MHIAAVHATAGPHAPAAVMLGSSLTCSSTMCCNLLPSVSLHTNQTGCLFEMHVLLLCRPRYFLFLSCKNIQASDADPEAAALLLCNHWCVGQAGIKLQQAKQRSGNVQQSMCWVVWCLYKRLATARRQTVSAVAESIDYCNSAGCLCCISCDYIWCNDEVQ